MSKSFFKSIPCHSHHRPNPSLLYVTLGNASIIHTFSLSITEMGNMSKRQKFSGSFLFNCQIWGSVSNHNVQALYMETSQLPSSAMPVICPTVNQPLKQAPLLSCPTCGVHHKARSSLYTLWCGIMCDGGGEKTTLNLFYHHIALSTGLANVFALTMVVCFLLLCIASDPDDPLTKLLFVI